MNPNPLIELEHINQELSEIDQLVPALKEKVMGGHIALTNREGIFELAVAREQLEQSAHRRDFLLRSAETLAKHAVKILKNEREELVRTVAQPLHEKRQDEATRTMTEKFGAGDFTDAVDAMPAVMEVLQWIQDSIIYHYDTPQVASRKISEFKQRLAPSAELPPRVG